MFQKWNNLKMLKMNNNNKKKVNMKNMKKKLLMMKQIFNNNKNKMIRIIKIMMQYFKIKINNNQIFNKLINKMDMLSKKSNSKILILESQQEMHQREFH